VKGELKRLACAFLGHKLTEEDVETHAFDRGWDCARCGRTQLWSNQAPEVQLSLIHVRLALSRLRALSEESNDD